MERNIIPGDFNDENLKYLYMSVQLGTMRAAADAFGVSPSSVSRQISHLEKTLGIDLVEKRSHKFKLSEAGKYVYEYYKERLVYKEVLFTNLDDLKGMRAGHYTLAVGEGFISTVLLSTLEAYIQKFPNVRLEIITAGTHEVISMVSEDIAHIGFVFEPPADPRIRVKFAIEQSLKAVVSPDHPLALQKAVSLKDLIEFPLILPREAFRIRAVLRKVEQQEEIQLMPSIATNSILLMRELVKSTQGVTIISELSIVDELDSGDLVAIPINNKELQETKAEVITRLGRVLPSGAQVMLNILSNVMSRWNQDHP